MRVLHLLSQRPSRTGSGVTLDALVRHAAAAGWDQRVMVGVPIDDAGVDVGNLPRERIETVTFGGGDLEFPVPGMSDVMPYPSTVFSSMTPAMLDLYRSVWRERLAHAVAEFRPDVIHAHHVWVLSALARDVAPRTPIVVHCHATGLRQMELCPHLADEVRRGVARADRFVVLHRGHADALARALAVPRDRITVVGAGYRDDLFHARDRAAPDAQRLADVGKYSASKGLPQLLDALERVAVQVPDVTLHVAGTGSGEEAERLAARMRTMAPRVVMHGAVPQGDLAALLRTCRVCVLPSYYEGVPLVLVEALACRCRLVATALPGVVEALSPHLGDLLDLVEPPSMTGVDVPEDSAIPAFVERLADALVVALRRPPLGDPAVERPEALAPFTWGAVFERVESVWKAAIADA